MAISSPAEFFTYELSVAYNTERTLLQGMQEMRQQAKSERLKRMLDNHFRETEQQISRLDQAFRDLGRQPLQIRCQAAEGLVNDVRTACQQLKDPNLIDLAIMDGWAKGEHLEIAAYRGLAEKARLLGNERVASTLSQILSQEEEEARNLELSGKEMGKDIIGGGPSIGGVTFGR